MAINIDLDKLSNIGIPVATILVTGALFFDNNKQAWILLSIGFVWWIIDQIIKWYRLKNLSEKMKN